MKTLQLIIICITFITLAIIFTQADIKKVLIKEAADEIMWDKHLKDTYSK